MIVSEVLDRARIILQDAEAIYWEESELPKWLSDGRLEAYRLRPDLFEVSEPFTCAEGARQHLPGGARVLFDVPRNVGAAPTRDHGCRCRGAGTCAAQLAQPGQGAGDPPLPL